MRTYNPEKYPNLAKLDRLVAEFLASDKAKELDDDRREDAVCRIHPIYWMEQHGQILQGKVEGSEDVSAGVEVKIIPFKLNATQLLIADRVCSNLIVRPWKPVRVNVLKCRKVGVSTLFAGFDYYFMRYVDHIEVFIIADIGKHTDNIFDMVVRFHKYDGAPFKPGKIPMARKKYGLRLANDSNCECDSGETKNPGTSQTIQIAHMSENAKWRQAKDAEQSLLDSIDRSGGFSFLVRESTAKGMNKFADDCELAEEGISDWQFVFIPWFDAEDCRTPLKVGEEFVPTPDEEDLMLLYNLDAEQLKFRRSKIHDIGLDRFKEDFPSHSREPFLTSAVSYFWLEKVKDRIEEIRFYESFKKRGIEASLRSKRFETIEIWFRAHQESRDRRQWLRDLANRCVIPRKVQIQEIAGKVTYRATPNAKDGDGYFTMWRPPLPDRKYLVVVDPAEGLSSNNYTSDNSVIDIIDAYRREQVAQFAGVYDEEVTARYAVLACLLYNRALLVVETNACGPRVIECIKNYQYFNFYRRQTLSKGQIVSTQEGWKTTRGNKKEVCSHLKLDFKNDDCLIHSVESLMEMLSFVEERGKLKASPGKKDDRVMVLSIGLAVIHQTPGLSGMTPDEAMREVTRGLGMRPPLQQVSDEWLPPSERSKLGVPDVSAAPSIAGHPIRLSEKRGRNRGTR